jgi:RNA polymerase sigma-70 factor (ECF subfamily)
VAAARAHGAETIRDLDGWLTTVVGRLALDTLRSVRSQREAYQGAGA